MLAAPRSLRRWMIGVGLAGAAAVTMAACGGSSSTASSTKAPPPTSAAPAGVTISSAKVAGVGTVLTNDKGLTLYLLTSEQGGKLTCTDDSGCTKVWPDTELPAGVTSATAGNGIDPSKLGTVKGSSGNLYVTYAGWLLYTFSQDSGPGTANGQGITSFGGTWETLAPSGTPVTVPRTTTTAPGSTTSLYHY